MKPLFLQLRIPWAALLLLMLALLACNQQTPIGMSDPQPGTLDLVGYSLASPTGTFQIHNSGSAGLTYSVRSDEVWLKVMNAHGQVAAGDSAAIHVQAQCPALPVADQGTLTVQSESSRATIATVTVHLQCRADDTWRVKPESLYVPGFTDLALPEEHAVTLHNLTLQERRFQVSSAADWLTVDQETLELSAGTTHSITVQVAPCAGGLEEQAHLTVQSEDETFLVPVTRRCTERTLGPDLMIERFYINQSVPAADSSQDPHTRIPVISGRDGLVRAFVRSSGTWGERVTVRLHYRTAGGQEGFIDLEGPEGVPQEIREGELNDTFNGMIAGHLLQAGMHVYLEVDPEGRVVDPNRSNNRYPLSGYMTLDVRHAPRLSITLVPVRHKGVTPVVDDSTKELYLERVRQMYPVAEIDIRIRAPYSFNGDLSTTNGWGKLLNELTNLRSADGSSRHYYGVIDPGYKQGVAGIGWIGLPIAAGWNRMPSGSAIVAHELGHNWGRGHAPCKTTGDVNYPHPEGATGVWGYDTARHALLGPDRKDIMSYCGPQWASDYTYLGVLEFRESMQETLNLQAHTRTLTLLISGLIEEHHVQLDPAFILQSHAQQTEPGPYLLVGLDADNQELFRTPFNAHVTSLHHEEMAGFNLAVPISEGTARTLTTLRVTHAGRTLAEHHATLTTQQVTPTLVEVKAGRQVTIRWDTRSYRSLMIRTAATGEILALDESGHVTLEHPGKELELLFSDGLRTTRETVHP